MNKTEYTLVGIVKALLHAPTQITYTPEEVSRILYYSNMGDVKRNYNSLLEEGANQIIEVAKESKQ